MEPPGRAAPFLRAVAAARMRDTVFAALAAAFGAWLSPFGSPVAGAVMAIVATGALRLAGPQGALHRHIRALAEPPPAPERPPPRIPGEARILDRLPIPYLVLDAGGQVQFCSSDARALLERDPRGQPVAAVFRAPQVLAAVETALRDGTDESIHFTARRPRERRFRAIVRTIRDGEGADRARILLALVDVTQARRLDAMRMDFVANASHELRTPLAAISGMIETLQGPARDDPAARDRFFPIIAREAARMARLVDDLLSLSRIELQQNVAPTGREDLHAILEEAVAATATLAEAGGNAIRLDVGTGPLPVRGDRDELLQVFVNLLTNAIRYGGPGLPVEIVPAPDDGSGRIGIAVRDHGIGIEPSLVPRLTERFYRVDKGRSVAGGGTGLGLAIVKHILTRHRGELRIDSVPGKGATFTVRLPGADASGTVPSETGDEGP